MPYEWNVIIGVVCGNYFTGETTRIMWGRETRTWPWWVALVKSFT
ncbi:hypothetical protein THOG10_150081 [Vibrio rotiferianus]|nr:hypothetical protein THOG10_150081 [Vibrio rotiferianus]CAH1578644.1 hypothetical protein THOE12_50393 [Vibrio rotiferianus]